MGKKVVCVVGKGHSGTRLIASTLAESGIFMGASLNVSMDKAPYEPFYALCAMAKGYAQKTSEVDWDFRRMLEEPVPDAFVRGCEDYLSDIHAHDGPVCGWKLTESNLVYPWLARLYPDWHYVHWVRDVRDHLFRPEKSDRMNHPGHRGPDQQMRIALNWKYQLDIVASVRPRNYLRVRLEDFVERQDDEIGRLGRFLGLDVAKLPVKPEVVASWRSRTSELDWSRLRFLDRYLDELGYPAPAR